MPPNGSAPRIERRRGARPVEPYDMSESPESWRPALRSASFPVLRLLRVYRYALDARRVAMAFLAVALVAILGRSLDAAWVSAGYGVEVRGAGDEKSLMGPFSVLASEQADAAAAIIRGAWSGDWGAHPVGRSSVMNGAGDAISSAHAMFHEQPLYMLLFGVIALFIVALFGGAICRSAVCEMGRDRVISVSDAISFAKARIVGMTMPIITVILLIALLLVMLWLWGLVFGWLVATCAGGLFYVIFGLLFGFALLLGFIAATMALLTAISFPLIWPAVAAEGSGGADALSRAVGFLTTRPGVVLTFWLILLILGGVAVTGARAFGVGTLAVTQSVVQSGMGDVQLWEMPPPTMLPPAKPGAIPFWGTFPDGELGAGAAIGRFFVKLWVFSVLAAVIGYALSFFMCGASQAYLLLRRSIDQVEFEDIYDDGSSPEATTVATPAAAESSPE